MEAKRRRGQSSSSRYAAMETARGLTCDGRMGMGMGMGMDTTYYCILSVWIQVPSHVASYSTYHHSSQGVPDIRERDGEMYERCSDTGNAIVPAVRKKRIASFMWKCLYFSTSTSTQGIEES